MRSLRKDATAVSLKLLVTLIAVLLSGSAAAECLPQQMQEANLAYQNAAQFLTAQQWDMAIDRLKSVVQFCPEHVEANRGIGTAYAGKGDFVQAAEWYRKVIDLRGENVEAGDFANLAKALAKQKKYKEARAEYMKAERLAPDDCGVLFNLGVMHYAAGFHTQSVEALEHSLEVCPQIREHALKQLAKSAAAAAKQQRRNGNNKKAAYYEGLVQEYGGQAGGSTTYDLITQKMKSKDYAGAVDLLEKMLAKNPDQANAWLTLARANDAQGKKGAAVDAYRKYLALKPDNHRETASLIQVLSEAGRCDEAVQAATAAEARFAAQGRKVMGKIWYTHGMALECREDFAGALAKYTKAAASNDSPWAELGRSSAERMQQTIDYQKAQKKRANQGG